VRDVLTDPNDAAIARTILGLGDTLELNAEGVETAEQRNFLALHGCRAFQGFPVRAAGSGGAVWKTALPGRRESRLAIGWPVSNMDRWSRGRRLRMFTNTLSGRRAASLPARQAIW
jgi:EAL domain-containing protein (putative c-di-GMP-specific phosphodiesterase class I)